MKINDANIVKELELVLCDVKQAIECSKNKSRNWFLLKAAGKLEVLTSILSVAKTENNVERIKENDMQKKYLISMIATYVDNEYGAAKGSQRLDIRKDIMSITGMTEEEAIEMEKEADYIIFPDE